MSNAVKTRAQSDPARQWRLEDIFESNSAWEQAFEEESKRIADFTRFDGKLTQSAQALLEALTAYTEMGIGMDRLYAYAAMRRDEDNSNALYQGMADRAGALYARLQEASSFLQPQLLAAPDGQIERYLEESDELKDYAFFLRDLLRAKPHTLSQEQERLIAMAGEVLDAPHTLYTMLIAADTTFPEIEGENGEKIRLTQGRFIPLMESSDRRVRKAAYDAFYSVFKGYSNTLAANYSAAVKGDLFYAKTHKHASSLASALFPADIPTQVYDNLTQAIRSRLGTLTEYLALRKKLLGLDKLHYYDLYVPLFSYESTVPYEQAQKTIAKALSPLGETYRADSAHAFTDFWVDVYENQGKTSGAYSNDCYGVHPYILMNYQNTLDSMFTLAHELGHAMHSFYSTAHNSYINAQYPIFLAEVASTTNELLLTRYCIDHAQSKEEKQYLLNYLLEQFRTTVYRQTLFAEFERSAHEAAERGEALTAESLSALYRKVNLEYYPDVEMDDSIPYEWSRIPHFYRNFYVYQYATGFTAAVKLSDDLYHNVPGAQQRYLKFLSSGGSKAPIEILRDAGVDMTKPDAILQGLDYFAQALDELKKTLEQA